MSRMTLNLETSRLRAMELPAVGGPVEHRFRVDEFAASLLGLQTGVMAESKTFRYQPDPWKILATNGTLLWVLSDISTTYVRALQGSTTVCYETLAFRGTPEGWRPNQPGNHLHQNSLNSGQGVLEDWDTGIPNADVLTNFTFTKSFQPDFYDLVASTLLVLDGGSWTHIR